MQGWAKIRSDLLHQSLTFNQPTKRHLISMLMRLTRSLLVQRCLYAARLERNNNGVPIRGRRKSPIPPCNAHQLLRSTLFAQFNQLQNRECRQTPKRHIYAHTATCASHIIRLAFGPSGFYCARLENGAIKSMREASAPFLLPRLPSAPPATN